MGYSNSITAETHDALEANRRAGRLCAGGWRHCTRRATRKVHTTTWLSEIGKGEPSSDARPLTLCTRHARDYHPGYRGVNFIVNEIERY